MEKEMITIENGMQLSKERLEEIFSVPKTKELYEKLIKQESNKEKIKVLTLRVEKIFEGEDFVTMTPADTIQQRLKLSILADSIERVINGKTLNQAIQAEIHAQLEETVVIKKVEAKIEEIESSISSMEDLERLIYMLS